MRIIHDKNRSIGRPAASLHRPLAPPMGRCSTLGCMRRTVLVSGDFDNDVDFRVWLDSDRAARQLHLRQQTFATKIKSSHLGQCRRHQLRTALFPEPNSEKWLSWIAISDPCGTAGGCGKFTIAPRKISCGPT